MEDGKKVSTDILHIKEDRCPDCGSELDTGYECNGCGKDWLHVIEKDKKRREAPCSSASAGKDSQQCVIPAFKCQYGSGRIKTSECPMIYVHIHGYYPDNFKCALQFLCPNLR